MQSISPTKSFCEQIDPINSKTSIQSTCELIDTEGMLMTNSFVQDTREVEHSPNITNPRISSKYNLTISTIPNPIISTISKPLSPSCSNHLSFPNTYLSSPPLSLIDSPDSKNIRQKVSQRNFDRLMMAKEIFLRYIDLNLPNQRKDTYTEIIPVALNLTCRCWKEFKVFVNEFGYIAKRRHATRDEKGVYDKTTRNKFVIGVFKKPLSVVSDCSINSIGHLNNGEQVFFGTGIIHNNVIGNIADDLYDLICDDNDMEDQNTSV
jgi:hypothetical protein